MLLGETGIIILNYNTYEETKLCIESVKKNVKSNYCIYLVDNHSAKGCVKKLISNFSQDKDVKLILLEKNLGYSNGNNQGIRRAIKDGMERILILNPDVELINDVVWLMSQELTDQIVCVGPKIYDIDGNNGQRIRKNYTFGLALFNKKPFYYLRHIFNKDNYFRYNPNDRFEFFGSLSGCCFLIDASIFKKINGFDSNVFLYSEEYILGKKLEKLGKKCCYSPTAKIMHKEGTSTKKISNAFVDYHIYVSEYYLLSEYCGLTRVQLKFIKLVRVANFFLKSIFYNGYWKRFNMLLQKFKEIDRGNLKITF